MSASPSYQLQVWQVPRAGAAGAGQALCQEGDSRLAHINMDKTCKGDVCLGDHTPREKQTLPPELFFHLVTGQDLGSGCVKSEVSGSV